jgi:hypothetical protein
MSDLKKRLQQAKLEPTPIDRIKAERNLGVELRHLKEEVAVAAPDISDALILHAADDRLDPAPLLV